MNLTFRMLQHSSVQEFKRKVRGWYLIRKMKKYINKPDFSLKSFKQNKTLASKEKVSQCQRSHSRQVVIRGSTKSRLFYTVHPNAPLLMFLQHALSCHVRHRSLLFIPIEVEMAEE